MMNLNKNTKDNVKQFYSNIADKSNIKFNSTPFNFGGNTATLNKTSFSSYKFPV